MSRLPTSSLLASGLLLLGAIPSASAQEVCASGIQGHRAFLHDTARGLRKVPVDLSAVPIDAWVQGADGQFTLYPGQGFADGTFSVPGVPEGATYTLRVGDELPWFTGTERRLDLSEFRLGRVDQAMPVESTPLVFDVDGLHPWQSGDLLQLISANAGMVVIDAHDWLSPGTPVDGDTRLSSATFELAWSSENRLVDAAHGDTAMLTHLSRPTAAPYRALTQVFTPAPFTTVEGQSTFLSGQFTDVPQTESLTYTFHDADFAVARADLHPDAEPTPGRAPSLVVSAMPTGYAHGFFSSIPDLLDTDLQEGTPSEPLRYGNPFPAAWRPVATVVYPLSVNYALDGTRPTRQSGSLVHTDVLRRVVGRPLAPILTPVRDMRVEGAPGTLNRVLQSLTPEVSWSAPAVGVPSGYEVWVRELYVLGTRTVAGIPLRLRTAQSRVTLPPGALESGRSYYLTVRALRQGSVDLARQPLRTDFPTASASAFSGILRAP
ncbi:hypothetical protein [Pyxidicoccus trucidator]|uniref:hypothetical protein n=1 Tax=Pyxidicoccus trucidator TaxID=2709662 RepID=UPI0013DB11E0|nr:hypothetical protein [Pyxidicoccus trucidator]